MDDGAPPAAPRPDPTNRDVDVDVASGKTGLKTVNEGNIGGKGVAAATAALDAGRAVLIVRAPFGSALRAGEIADAFSPIAMPGLGRDLYMLENPEGARVGRVLRDHPLFLTRPYDVSTKRRGLITPEFGFPTLKKRSGKTSAWSGTVRMSKFFWPTSLLSQKPRKNSAWSGTHFMSRWFWPGPMLSRR